MHKLTHGITWFVLIAALATNLQAGGFATDPLPKGALARLGSSRLRHTWSVRSLAFSPNGKFLVSAGEETGGGGESAIRVWEIPSGREVKTIPLGYHGRVRQLAISPDGSKVVWVDGSGAIHGIDIPIALQLVMGSDIEDPFDRRKFVAVQAKPLAFSPDGKFFATGSGGGLIVVGVKAKKTIMTGRVGKFDRCVFSPDSNTLAISHPEVGLRLIDVTPASFNKGQLVKFPAIRPGPTCFGFSPDGDQLVTGELNLIKIWDIAAAKEVRRIAWGNRTALAVAFAADGKQVTAVGDDGRVSSWLASSGKDVQAFALPPKTLPDGLFLRIRFDQGDIMDRIAISADGNWFAASNLSAAINLVNITTGKKVAFADGQPGNHYSYAFAFTPDSKHLITASEEDRLQIWEARTGKLIRTSKDATDSVFWLDVTPNGKQVIGLSYSRAERKTLRLEEWNLASAKRVRQIDLGITPGIPAMSPNGKWLAFGEPNDSSSRMHKTGDAILVDRATGKEIHHFDAGDKSAPQDLTFSSNGKMLATINPSGTIRVWDTATGKLVQSMKAEGHESLYYRLRFTSGDKTIVSTSMSYGEKAVSSHIVEWSVATGNAETRREGPKDLYWCQALSPDGKLFAWVGRHYQGLGEQIELWSVNQQKARQTCEGLRGGARLLGFSPDGRLLAGGCYDGTILIWGVNPE